MKKIDNFPIFSSKLRLITATVLKLGFLDSGFDQKSNGTRILSPAFKEWELSLIRLQTLFCFRRGFQNRYRVNFLKIFFGTLIRIDRGQNVLRRCCQHWFIDKTIFNIFDWNSEYFLPHWKFSVKINRTFKN